jgi:hypothetical protein
VTHHFRYRCISYYTAKKKDRADWGSAESYTQIHNHNYAKMHWMYAEVCNNRQKNGRENQECRRHIHKGANGKQNKVYD